MGKKKTGAEGRPGYANPPVHSRFKPGRSGNPGGRKKGSRNFRTLLKEVMESEIELTERVKGTKRVVPLVEALLLRLAQDGLEGNPRAIENLLSRYERYADGSNAVPEELPEDDEQMLEEYLTRRERRSRGESSEESDE